MGNRKCVGGWNLGESFWSIISFDEKLWLFIIPCGYENVQKCAQVAQIHAELFDNICKLAPFLPRHAITPVQNNIKII